MGTQASKPRRIVTRLLVFLLLGAVVNVAVASIGLDRARQILLMNYRLRTYQVVIGQEFKCSHEQALRWNRFAAENWPQLPQGVNHFRQLTAESEDLWSYGPSGGMSYMASQSPRFSLGDMHVAQVCGGYPMRTFRYEQWSTGSGPMMDSGDNGWHISRLVVPSVAIWPGLAINTIFYAAILWLLWAAPGAIRRLRRKQRGQCIHCGYDLRGAPADSVNCPECGRSFAPTRYT